MIKSRAVADILKEYYGIREAEDELLSYKSDEEEEKEEEEGKEKEEEEKKMKECRMKEAFFGTNYNVILENGEPQVKIGPVEKGALELPKGKDVEETSVEHFKDLIQKDGWLAVSKRIIALKVWNRNRDPELSNKMDKLQAKLADWVESKRKENPDFATK